MYLRIHQDDSSSDRFDITIYNYTPLNEVNEMMTLVLVIGFAVALYIAVPAVKEAVDGIVAKIAGKK